jgi:hypothetical protein
LKILELLATYLDLCTFHGLTFEASNCQLAWNKEYKYDSTIKIPVNFKSGIYLLELNGKESVITKKIIIRN